MGTRVKRVLAVLAAIAVAVVAAAGLLAYRVFNPTDCYDHAAVGRLDADPVEDVRPDGAMLVSPAEDPQCNWIEPRYLDASRTWTFAVADVSRVDDVVADLSAGAMKAGWRSQSSSGPGWASGSASGPPLGDEVFLEMTKDVGSVHPVGSSGQVQTIEARLVVTSWIVDDLDATDEHPEGSAMVSVMTEITESP